MKKLIAMIGAVATAFGLYAAEPGIVSATETFNSGTVGEQFSLAPAESAPTVWSPVAGENTLTVKERTAGDNYVEVETEGTLYRTIGDCDNLTAFQKFDFGTVYLDTDVKFTAGEGAPDAGDNTQLALWLQETEGDDETTTTNLMVKCGAISEDGEVIPQVFTIAGDYAADQWYHVTIKTILDDIANIGCFVIAIDNTVVASTEVVVNDAIVEDLFNESNQALIAAKQLFPSMLSYESLASGKLSAIGFNGTGSLDNVGVSEMSAIALVAPANATIASVMVGDKVIPLEGGKYIVAKGATVEVTLAADEGYIITGTNPVTFTAGEDIENLFDDTTVEPAEKPFGIIITDGSKTNYYDTLALAVAAAQPGETVTIFEDATLTTSTYIEKALAINLNGNTLTFADGVVDGIVFQGADGVISNGTFASTLSTLQNGLCIDFNSANGLLKDLTISTHNFKWGIGGDLAGDNDWQTATPPTFTVTCENVDVSGERSVVQAEGVNLTLDADCTVTQTGTGDSEEWRYCAIHAGFNAVVTIAGGTYASEQFVICKMSSPATIKVSGGDFTGTLKSYEISPASREEYGSDLWEITGGTFTVDPTEYLADGYWADTTVQSGKWVVKAKGAFAIILAGTTDPIYRDTLAEAVAAADDGATITVIADATVVDWVRVDKEITLDLNGKTIAADVDNWTKGSDAVIAVGRGGKLTIDDTSVDGDGVIDSKTIMCAVKMTQTGALDTENPYAATPTAQLIVNGGNLKGYEYGISGNGNAGRGNTAVTINGGVIEATATASNVAPKVNSIGIYNPQKGTLTVNGGIIKGNMGIYVKSGDVITEFTDGLVQGNGAYDDYGVNNNGADNTGVALAIDNANYPGGVPTANIKGGKFESLNNVAVASYARTDGEEVANFISGGQFKSATGKTMSDALLASGFAYGTPGEDGWVSVAQSKGFIIRVAGIDATAVTEGEAAFTIATADKPLVYIAGQAATVEGTAGAWTVAKPEITADTCVSVVKDQAIAAVGTKWYVNPTLVGKVANYYGVDLAPGFASDFDAAGNFFVHANGFVGRAGGVGTLAKTIAEGLDATYVYNYPGYGVDDKGVPWGNPIYKEIRGATISTAYGVMIAGTQVNTNPGLRMYSLVDGSLLGGIHLFKEDGTTEIFPGAFAIVGNDLWVNDYVGEAKALFKFTIPAGGFIDGASWTAVKTVSFSTKGKQHFRAHKIGDTTYFYIFGEDANGMFLGSDADGATFAAQAGFNADRYSDVAIAGEHIYFFDYPTGKITVYALDTETGWVTGDAIATFDAPAKSKGASIFVTQDEENLIFCGEDGTFVYQYTTPVYTVTFNVDGAEYAVSNVLENTVCGKPTDPVKEGFKFVNWTNETCAAGFDFTTPITANLTLEANFEAVQTWPEAWDTPEFEALTDEEKKAYGDKFKAWKDEFPTAGDLTAAQLNNFLLNIAPDATPELKIDSITVEGTTATIVVSAGTADLEKVNGVLYVDGANDLTNWTTTEVDLGKDATFVEGKATFEVDGAKFMKAGVGFKAPVVEAE